MTLKEYKRQVDELSEAMAGFDGPEEETLKFLENLSQKYAEVSEFNIRAVECKNLEEFKTLANSYGIEFSSDDEAKELFGQLTEGAKTLTKMVLSEAEMTGVSGGGVFDDCAYVLGVDPGCLAASGFAGAVAGGGLGATMGPHRLGSWLNACFGATMGAALGVLSLPLRACFAEGASWLVDAFVSRLASEMIKRGGYTPPQLS